MKKIISLVGFACLLSSSAMADASLKCGNESRALAEKLVKSMLSISYNISEQNISATGAPISSMSLDEGSNDEKEIVTVPVIYSFAASQQELPITSNVSIQVTQNKFTSGKPSKTTCAFVKAEVLQLGE